MILVRYNGEKNQTLKKNQQKSVYFYTTPCPWAWGRRVFPK
jgi:hypothetical protein